METSRSTWICARFDAAGLTDIFQATPQYQQGVSLFLEHLHNGGSAFTKV